MADEFCLKTPGFHVTFRDLLHVVSLRHGTNGFTSLPKEAAFCSLLLWRSTIYVERGVGRSYFLKESVIHGKGETSLSEDCTVHAAVWSRKASFTVIVLLLCIRHDL